MPSLINYLFQNMGISLNIPKNTNVHKRFDKKKCRHKKVFHSSVRKEMIDVELKKSDCEVSAHITVDEEKCIRLWGQVKDYEGNPVKDALIKLVKPVYQSENTDYVGVAHTITDNLGFYKFDLSPADENINFIIIASKANSGNERVIDENCSLCNPCE